VSTVVEAVPVVLDVVMVVAVALQMVSELVVTVEPTDVSTEVM